MGRRKERRLAAMSNAGRRVKLDLFAEPSGDLGGSTVHDEVGVDTESKQRSGLPNSPSTSGQQPENPLLLLGQYSDDELEEDSDKKLDDGSAVETSSPSNKDEAVVLLGESCPEVDVNTNEVKPHEVEKDTTLLGICQKLEDPNKCESNAKASSDCCKDTGQVPTFGACDQEPIGDASSGWQVVMHEESNQYYYWNTETGETSWEVPQALAQAAELAGNHNTHAVTERTGNDLTETGVANLTSVVTVDNLSGATSVEGLYPVEWIGGVKNVVHNDSNWGNDDVDSGFFNSNLGDVNSTKACSGKVTDFTAGVEDESGIDLCSHLIKLSESLLERLKSVKESKNQLQSLECILKYSLEVEIRLSDIKALSSFGSSLQQFWVHSERQLKRLEDSINLEIYKIAESAIIGDTYVQSMEHEPDVNVATNRVTVSCSENTHISPVIGTRTGVLKDADDKICPSNAIPNIHADSNSSELINGAAPPDESMLKHRFLDAEDVDMDVDMEVEDATSAGNAADVKESGVNMSPVLSLPKIQTVQPAPHTSIASNEAVTVPALPDNEWIPPPPPDNEQIPPPPPDEPPEPVHPLPPSYPEAGLLAPYAEQYSLPFPNSSLAYYGHAATEVASSSFYGQVEGLQVVASEPAIFYSAVPNTYAEVAQITVNSVAPAAYYDFQAGDVPPAPGVSASESYQLQREPTPISYATVASEHMVSSDPCVEAVPNLLPAVHGSSFGVSGEPGRASIEVLPAATATTVKAPAVVSENESVQPPSSNTVSAAVSATSTVTKVQTKVARSKKRTAAVAVAPSLRSSKKVSSLVNKWKAAKEELLEYEEEPQTAYEILERKRQKEIEEWHAQQIASGEAKDNANFQPLGGDWRERVKRRRAQQASEAAQTSPEALNGETRQPDLTKLSKDLPSGWQVYWDESSKQVYYGNVVTSETTWTRPTT